jgi:hypothetical protein
MPRIIGYRCPICKTVNPTEIKYCLKCGQWLLDTINEATPVTRGSYFKKTSNSRSLLSWKNILVAVVIGIILIAISSTRTITMPVLAFSKGTPVESKNYTWDYRGKSYQWEVEIPLSLLNYDRQITNDLQKYLNAGKSERQAMYKVMPSVQKKYLQDASKKNYVAWVTESNNYQFTGYIAQWLDMQAEKENLDSVQKVEFVQSFVGGAIPYQLDTGLQFPAQTLAESGKCSDKSFLAAAILANMGYKVALLSFHTKNHMTVGVALDGTTPSYSPAAGFDYNGTKYYFLEVTAAGWKVGQASSGLGAVEPEVIIPVSCIPALRG